MKRGYIIGAIILIAILGLAYAYGRDGNRGPASDGGQIQSFEVTKPNFVATSKGLSAIEVKGMPTGTGITSAEAVNLGRMTLISGNAESQVWTLPIPKEPMLLTSVTAYGYDKQGGAVGNVSLRETGATSLMDLLWGKESGTPSGTTGNETGGTPASTKVNQNVVLALGESKTVGGLTITAKKIVEDSRCPADVQCIQAGRLVLSIELKKGSEVKTVSMSSDKNEVISFAGYKIDLLRIYPDRVSTTELLQSSYRFTFNISN